MRYSLNQGSADSVPVSPLLFPATRCVFATFRSFRPAPLRKSRRFILLRALELSCRSFCNSDPLFSMACSLFRKTPRGMGIPDGSVGPFGMPTPLLPNHIPATPVVSCNYALFRATARRYPSYSQWLPHSFYRHRRGTPLTSALRSLCPLCGPFSHFSLLLPNPSPALNTS